MRMWGVPVNMMCTRHLAGEHAELEMFVWNIRHGRNLTGYYVGGLMDTRLIQVRHNDLAAEIDRRVRAGESRGKGHNSPLVYNDRLGLGSIDVDANLVELARRCPRCKERIEASERR